MGDTISPPTQHIAHTRRSRRVPVIWLIPFIAIAIGAWLAWDTISKEGPKITITFDSAEGLQAGQSQLRFRDIVLGTVKSLALAPDNSHVIVTIDTTRQAGPLLTDKTVFWVVKPRLFAGNLSGLDTLLSGAYVGMLPGTTAGKPQRTFTGHEDPPVLGAHVPGHTFLLRATKVGSISAGSPVFFRDLNVGEVLGWDVEDMARRVVIHAFVRSPYDRYVNDDTRFWNASGMSVNLGAAGVELQIESLRALLLGGIAFSTPDEQANAPMSVEDHVFPLFANEKAAAAASYTREIPLVSYFNGSVRGLAAGSEVVMHGLVVGHVTNVSITYDRATDTVVAPVQYEVEPERIVGVGKRVFATTRETMEDVLRHGLRASLASANLITGQQMISLDFAKNAPPVPLEMQGNAFVLPTAEGSGLAGLQASVGALLDKVSEVPFREIGDNLNRLLKTTNSTISGPELQQALKNLSATLESAKDLTENLNSGTSPAMRQLPTIVKQLEQTITGLDKLVSSLNNGYGGDTQFSRDLDRLLRQANDAVSSFRALADLLTRHPEALVKGRPDGGTE
ncbi:MAG TPA: MlaD family protein [Acetobacteraceae bacterium]|nr:MlaD family protein [Acetobacteraceae bacterium]